MSPILIKQKDYDEYITFKNREDFETILIAVTKNKLLKIDPKLDLYDFNIKCDLKGARTKRLKVKNTTEDSTLCQFDVYCNKKVAEVLYNVGIGKSTGSGFGTICKTENIRKYINK